MPWNRQDYPPTWEAIRVAVRARSGDVCEAFHSDDSTHRCAVANGVRLHRLRRWPEETTPCTGDRWCVVCRGTRYAMYGWLPAVKVVLTVAHTCHDTHCEDLAHLKHWCQLHHNRYDAPMRGKHAAETKAVKKEQARVQQQDTIVRLLSIGSPHGACLARGEAPEGEAAAAGGADAEDA